MVLQLEEVASPKVAEKLKEWKPDEMSREEQWRFVRALSRIENEEHNDHRTTYDPVGNKTFDYSKRHELVAEGYYAYHDHRCALHKEPWRPEFDEMCLLFMTPEEIKERQDKGMSKEDIIKEAKDMIVTAKWKECKEKAFRGGHDSYFRGSGAGAGGFGRLMIEAACRNKRYYEDYIFSDEPVRNTLDAIANRGIMRDLMNQDVHWVCENDYINKDYVPMPREEREDFHPLAILKRAFQSSAKRAEEDRKRKAERDEKKRKYIKVYGVKKVLTHYGKSRGGIGAKSLDFVTNNGFDIDFDAMKSVAGCVDTAQKKVLLNSSITHEEQALSMINAACFVKQEMNGAGRTEEDKAIRKADALVTQIRFIQSISFPDPLLEATFKWNGNDPALLEQYHEIQRERGENAACSACIDAYLSKALPDKKPSPEKIASICRNFDGTSYYTAQTKTDAVEKNKPQKSEAVSENKIKSLNPSFIDKIKQNGR